MPLASQYLPTFELPNQLPAGPAESGFRRLVFVCVEDLNYARACAERPVAVLPIGAAAAAAALEAVEAGVAMAEASTSRQVPCPTRQSSPNRKQNIMITRTHVTDLSRGAVCTHIFMYVYIFRVYMSMELILNGRESLR